MDPPGNPDRPSPTQPVSLFFALRPTPGVAVRVAKLAQQHRKDRGLIGRPLATNRFHVTLMSIGAGTGAVPDAVMQMARTIGDTVRFLPFEIAFDRAASFARSQGNRPYVLLGEDGVIDARMLHRSLVGASLKFLDCERAFRRFTPHVTLLYDDLQLDEQKIEPISWLVEELLLIESWVGLTKHIVRGRWLSSERSSRGTLLRA